jgi:hypothetical protein
MYQSLKEHLDDFCLYVFPFDDECLKILKELNLPNIVVVSLQEFEDEELLKIKNTRSPMEYCWTCSSNSTWYTLKKYNLESITYIDADLYFYSSPEPIFNELGNDSILITEHRFSRDKDKAALAGKYCVQFMTFKNNPDGWRALDWWRTACLNWCYAKYEDNKFGDQKYLDDWMTRFSGVHELQHLGGGVAIWNINNYNISMESGSLQVIEKSSAKKFPLIFYHFHSVKLFRLGNRIIGESTQPIIHNVQKLIYNSYTRGLTQAFDVVKTVRPDFSLGLSPNLIYYRKKLGKFLPTKIKSFFKKVIT